MIDKLEFFIALARAQHFGRAAEACAVTQPALSMQIKELEDELQVSLIERRKSGIELTEQGEDRGCEKNRDGHAHLAPPSFVLKGNDAPRANASNPSAGANRIRFSGLAFRLSAAAFATAPR